MKDNSTDIISENTIIINTLSEYIEAITSIRNGIIEDGSSETLFFRGQCNNLWDIRPSIFRDSLISVEHKIIQTAKARVPEEFRSCISPFEELTKLQHYGLPTRLLDITMNPLVALYFACQPIIYTIKDNQSMPYGVVYICTGYEEHEMSFKSKLLSTIAQIDFDGNITLKSLKQKLDIKENLDADVFIKLIQDSIFVMPSYSNTRLIRQCGAFIISGAISVTVDETDIWNSKIAKCVRNLNQEVDKRHLLIPNESKEDLLDELDFLNINESTLFPELEHQMSHIKKVGFRWVTDESPAFIKYETNTKIVSPTTEDTALIINDEDIYRVLKTNGLSKQQRESVLATIKNIMKYPDWNHKENTYNELIREIKRMLKQLGYFNPQNKAINIVNDLISM